jgi:thioredoxin-related protein
MMKTLFIFSMIMLAGHLVMAHTAFDLGKLTRVADEVEDPLSPSITWYPFEKAIDANKEEKKFIFIDLYTDWCGWCKRMDQSTFLDTSVATYMNEHFYAVKMNAESKEAIAYKEVLYGYKTYGNKGYNELAYSLLGGQMSFPSFVVLSKKEVKLGTIVGFKQPFELISALKAYVEK